MGLESLMGEMLRTNQLQMQLLAEMTKVIGKVADILVPNGVPEAANGRFAEEWLIPEEKTEADGSH